MLRKMLIINAKENNLIFYFINYFLFLTFYNNAFNSKLIKFIKNVF